MAFVYTPSPGARRWSIGAHNLALDIRNVSDNLGTAVQHLCVHQSSTAVGMWDYLGNLPPGDETTGNAGNIWMLNVSTGGIAYDPPGPIVFPGGNALACMNLYREAMVTTHWLTYLNDMIGHIFGLTPSQPTPPPETGWPASTWQVAQQSLAVGMQKVRWDTTTNKLVVDA